MATKAYQSEAHLDRQDKMLDFGSSSTLAATGAAVIGGDATHTDGTYLDLGNTDLEGMSVIFHVNAAITGTGTVTATFKVSVSNNDGSSWTEIAASPAIGSANLTAGKEFAVAIPRGAVQGNLMKAGVTLAGTSITGGKVSAYVDTYIGK